METKEICRRLLAEDRKLRQEIKPYEDLGINVPQVELLMIVLDILGLPEDNTNTASEADMVAHFKGKDKGKVFSRDWFFDAWYGEEMAIDAFIREVEKTRNKVLRLRSKSET